MNYLKPCPKCRMPSGWVMLRAATSAVPADLIRVYVTCTSCNYESYPPAVATPDKLMEAREFAAKRWNTERRLEDQPCIKQQ